MCIAHSYVSPLRIELIEATKGDLIYTSQDESGLGLEGDGHNTYFDTEKLIEIMLEGTQRPKARVTPEKIFPA
jgi:hypothetical protein